MTIARDGDAKEVEDGPFVVEQGIFENGLSVTEFLIAQKLFVHLGQGQTLLVKAQLGDNPEADTKFTTLRLCFHTGAKVGKIILLHKKVRIFRSKHKKFVLALAIFAVSKDK